MIIKSYEVKKKEFKNIKFFLLYGKNQGLINETIKIDVSGNDISNHLEDIMVEVIANKPKEL